MSASHHAGIIAAPAAVADAGMPCVPRHSGRSVSGARVRAVARLAEERDDFAAVAATS